MSKGVQLIVLRCPTCNSDLTGEKEGVFLYCPGCGAGFEITPEDQLSPIKVYFARSHTQAVTFLPFWAFDARMQLKQREAKTQLFGSSKGLIRLFEERETIRFYVPAYLQDLETGKPRALK